MTLTSSTPVQPLVDAVAATSNARLLEIMRDHAVALAAGDAAQVDEVSQQFSTAGAILLAGEAAAQAALLAEQAGASIRSRRSAVRARQLVGDSSAHTPALRQAPKALSDREFEVAELAASSLSSSGDRRAVVHFGAHRRQPPAPGLPTSRCARTRRAHRTAG